MHRQAPLRQTLRIGDLHPLRVVTHPGREHLQLTDQIAGPSAAITASCPFTV
jgi:hypothetical protein